MKPLHFALGIVSTVVALALIGFGLFILQIHNLMIVAFGVGFAAILFYGWVTYAFLYYRYIRQGELLGVLTTAAESQTPLSPALWAYVHDRPNNPMREFWSALLLFFVLPGYYWFWYRRNNFDRKVERVAMRLESGYSLHEALRTVPGVASRETLLAAAVGENTGHLDRCLKAVPRLRLAQVWFEAFPRIIYPLLVLNAVLGVVSFHMAFIFPKIEKIFADFRFSRMPQITEKVFGAMRMFGFEFGLLIGLGFLSAIVGSILIACSASFRWYFPGVAWLGRMHLRGRFLKMLSVLLETGMPLPQALNVLADSGYFRGPAQGRLKRVCEAVEAGDPFAQNLQRQGLLPGNMVALVEAGQRANNLPWVLGELGDHLSKRCLRNLERISFTLFPILTLLTGLIVGAVALAFFLPLVNLIEGMTP